MVTYRIYCLLDKQKKELLDFLLCDDPENAHCPLPLVGGDMNRKRVDAEEPVTATGIYRDRWERKEIRPDQDRRRIRARIPDWIDYRSVEDWQAAVRRGGAMERAWYQRHQNGI